VHGPEALFLGDGSEPGPPLGFRAQIRDADRFTGLVAVQTRSFVALQLEGFEFACFLGGGRQEV